MPSKGLILVNVNTLADGDPLNNFLEARGHVEREQRARRRAPHHAWRPLRLRRRRCGNGDRRSRRPAAAEARVRGAAARASRASALQFRYLFALDDAGLTTIDVTDPVQAASRRVGARAARRRAAPLRRAHLRLRRGRARRGSPSSTSSGPRRRALYMKYTADGKLNDARDVIVAIDQRVAVRLRRRRRQRPQGACSSRRRTRSRSSTASRRNPSRSSSPGAIPPRRRSHCRRGSIATAPSTRPAARSRCSAASARGRSPGTR